MNLESRLKIIEDKSCSLDFVERMEDIFSNEKWDILTSKDVQKLREFLPDKFQIFSDELYKKTSENI